MAGRAEDPKDKGGRRKVPVSSSPVCCFHDHWPWFTVGELKFE